MYEPLVKEFKLEMNKLVHQYSIENDQFYE